ncbi:nattectin [Aphelenchoides avenae]|nr:nattectin [Aphelenchus avenae]
MSRRAVFVVLLFAVLVAEARRGRCPVGIYRGDHCLKPGFGQKNWQDAEAHCVSLGGHLTSVPNDAEESYLVRRILPQNDIDFWLGGRQQTDGKWTWSDGNSFNYAAWADGM